MLYHLHQLLSSLPLFLDVTKVTVVAMILEEGVDPLEGNVTHMVTDRVALIINTTSTQTLWEE